MIFCMKSTGGWHDKRYFLFLRAAISTLYAISQFCIIHVVHIQFGFGPKHVFVHSFQNFQDTVRNNIKILDIKILIVLIITISFASTKYQLISYLSRNYIFGPNRSFNYKITLMWKSKEKCAWYMFLLWFSICKGVKRLSTSDAVFIDYCKLIRLLIGLRLPDFLGHMGWVS